MSRLSQAADRLQIWNRTRKVEQFFEHCRTAADHRVIDVGFAPVGGRGIENVLETFVDDLSTVTALTVDDPTPAIEHYPGMRIVQYDGTIMPFGDREFDAAWSNAVVEHVGDEDARVLFVSEMCRIADTVMFTTPNKFFPIESHTRIPLLHILLPKAAFDWVLHRIGRSWATGSYMHLMGYRELASIVERAGVAGATIHRNKLGPLTMDFSVIVNSRVE